MDFVISGNNWKPSSHRLGAIGMLVKPATSCNVSLLAIRDSPLQHVTCPSCLVTDCEGCVAHHILKTEMRAAFKKLVGTALMLTPRGRKLSGQQAALVVS